MAIAFQQGIFNSTQSSSPYTQNLTCSGADRLLVVGIGFNGASQTITDVQFGGVSATKRVDSTGDSADDYDHQIWTLKNPTITPTTNLTVTWTGGGNAFFYAANFTGVEDYDNSTHGGTASSPLTLTMTPNAYGCWTIMMASDGGSFPSAGSGTTNRGTNGGTWFFGDSNGPVNGSTSLQATWTGGTGGGGVMISISPKRLSTTTALSTTNAYTVWNMDGTVGSAGKIDNGEGTAARDLVETGAVTAVTGWTGTTSNGAYGGFGANKNLKVTNANWSSPPTGAQTWEAWVFPTAYQTGSGVAFIASKNGATAGTYLYVDGTGHVGFSGTGAVTKTINSTGTISLNEWHHVVGTFVPGYSMSIFIDGALDKTDTTSIPSVFNSTTQDFFIGTQTNVVADGTYSWLGYIDSFKISTVAVSEAYVKEYYLSGISTATQCLTLNGSSQRAAAVDSVTLSQTGDQTHEGWVKWTTLPTAGNEATIFGKYTATGNQRGISVTLLNTAGVYSFQARTSSNGSGVSFNNTNLLQTPVTGVWYHYRFVYIAASSKITFYVNGMNPLDITTLTASIYDNTSDYTLGWAADTGYAAAQFSNWRVWGNQHTSLDSMESYGFGYPNLKAEWTLNGVETDASGNTNTLSYTGSPSYTTDSPFPSQQVSSTALVGNLVSYWAFNESSGNATDSKGSNTLTNNNTVTYAAAKQGNGATLVSASTQSFTIADASQSGLDIAGDMTMALWVNPTTISATEWMLASKWDDTSNNRGYAIIMTDTQMAFYNDNDGTAPGNQRLVTIGTFSTSTWYHLAYVYDASAGSVSFYINGVLANTATGANTSLFNNAAAFGVGYVNATGGQYNGKIDELGIWTETLSPEAINALYNEGTGIPYAVSVSSTPTLSIQKFKGIYRY